jgi:hypothetical protein
MLVSFFFFFFFLSLENNGNRVIVMTAVPTVLEAGVAHFLHARRAL